eukprot:3171298-Amphidinium_carterae.1
MFSIVLSQSPPQAVACIVTSMITAPSRTILPLIYPLQTIFLLATALQIAEPVGFVDCCGKVGVCVTQCERKQWR